MSESVICTGAGDKACEGWNCSHRKPHDYDDEHCMPESCFPDGEMVCCEPVKDGDDESE